MEYLLMLMGMAVTVLGQVKMGLGAAYDKIFEHTWLLVLVCGAAILLGLWSIKTAR
jgi:hypothetical protein